MNKQNDEWLRSLIGRRYQLAGVGPVYVCVAADARDVTVRNEADPLDVRRLSDRAIGRTFLEVRNLEDVAG